MTALYNPIYIDLFNLFKHGKPSRANFYDENDDDLTVNDIYELAKPMLKRCTQNALDNFPGKGVFLVMHEIGANTKHQFNWSRYDHDRAPYVQEINVVIRRLCDMIKCLNDPTRLTVKLIEVQVQNNIRNDGIHLQNHAYS